MKEQEEIPRAFARRVADSLRIVVERCPYCGRSHAHAEAPDGDLQRMADCFRGEYILSFDERVEDL